MAINVEIKARVKDIDALRDNVEVNCDKFSGLIEQEDIFFNVESGRLKLRILAADHGQLIFYQRPDRFGPKVSEYHISETAEPEKLKSVLSKALGIRGVVRKERHLYWIGQTRIHLDQVEGLGDQPCTPTYELDLFAASYVDHPAACGPLLRSRISSIASRTSSIERPESTVSSLPCER